MTQWNFVDALGDGVYGVDTAGLCVFVNTAALRILGYAEPGELLGRNMHALIHHTRPDGSPFAQAECPLLHTLSTGHAVRLEHEMLWRRDGTPFLAEYSSFPVVTDGTITGSVITFSDNAVRQDAQRRLSVQYTVSQVLAGRGAPETMPARILEAIGAGLAWDVGLYWQHEDGEGLRCMAQWHARDAGAAVAFADRSAGCLLTADAGIVSQVLAATRPVHVADLAVAPAGGRQVEAAQHGLQSGFGFPIMAGEFAVGAVEFYSRRRIDVDGGLLEAAATLGQQIGQTLERHRVASALAESERMKAAILASSPDCVITVDAACRVVEFNQSAERTFGRTAAHTLGADLIALIFPPDSQQSHRRAFAQAVNGQPGVLDRRIEVDAIRADGARFPIELSLTNTATRPHLLFTAHLRDITARRQGEAIIRTNEARFRTIANAIPQLAWMTGPDGGIVWYNQRWFDYTGTTFEQMAGWGWKSVHHPDHVDRVEQHLRESFAAGAAWEDTFPLRGCDGAYRWFLSRALPIRDDPDEACAEGRILGWFGSNTDITALRDAEQTLAAARDEAEAANRAKSTFIANMSHELRTPLSAIIGYAEMLIEEIDDGAAPSEFGDDVKKIEGNARHLLGLINDVLDLSKVESGKMEAYPEHFDVAAIADEVASAVGGLVEKKGNVLRLNLASGLGAMHSDVTRIRQMLLNLLSNAAKFTEHGTITLSITRAAGPGGHDWMAFTVADTGIGMTPEQLAKLFQRFQQADASTTRQFGGTGLGLALTKAFAALLGGEIAVHSDEGVGSTFILRLPTQLPQEAPPAVEQEQGAAAGEEERDVVLVIDDDETQRDLMSRFLVREGYAARTAAEGATGLALARRLHPRAILLDVTMPGMDGWSVLSALKADAELADIPVVMVTFTNERALATSLGAADYIFKPVDWDRLRLVMERFREAEGDVLVVDDDAPTRRRLRLALEKHHWSVKEAANGQEALAHVAHAVPRMILLDLDMPVMDGFEFLQALRERPGCGNVPVVVLTALHLTAENRRRLRGATQILSKGATSLSDLVEKLRTLELSVG